MSSVRSWRASERMRWAISAPEVSPRALIVLGGVTLGLGEAGFGRREEARMATHLESEDLFFGAGSFSAASEPFEAFGFFACAVGSPASSGFSVANVTLVAWRS